MTTPPSLDDFPARAQDKLRYGDTDRQGHVNNAVFATLFETGRVEVIFDEDGPLADDGASFVIARLSIDFLAELHWPGAVDVGSRVSRVGTSSVTLEQALFQDGRCCASAVSTIVQVDAQTHRPRPLSDSAATRFAALLAAGAADSSPGTAAP